MAKTDLLKEAIADARAVRETALANAKIALEEAFTPRIQSMLSAKLSEEEGMEDEMTEDEEMAAEEPAPAMEEEEDLELEAIIKELEDEMAVEEELDSSDIGKGDNKVDVAYGKDQEDPGKGDLTKGHIGEAEGDKEDVDLEEIINALREDEGGEEETTDEGQRGDKEVDEADDSAKEDLEEAYKVIRFMKSKLNEVNLLNAKLLFSNKLFRNHSLNVSQKMKVIENFDRAQTLREVKLVFATLSESFNLNGRKKKTIKESYASRPTRTTRPAKKILSEGNTLANRWKKLAGLNG